MQRVIITVTDNSISLAVTLTAHYKRAFNENAARLFMVKTDNSREPNPDIRKLYWVDINGGGDNLQIAVNPYLNDFGADARVPSRALAAIRGTLYMTALGEDSLFAIDINSGAIIARDNPITILDNANIEGLAAIGSTLYMAGYATDAWELYGWDAAAGGNVTTVGDFNIDVRYPGGLTAVDNLLYLIDGGSDILWALDPVTLTARSLGRDLLYIDRANTPPPREYLSYGGGLAEFGGDFYAAEDNREGNEGLYRLNAFSDRSAKRIGGLGDGFPLGLACVYCSEFSGPLSVSITAGADAAGGDGSVSNPLIARRVPNGVFGLLLASGRRGVYEYSLLSADVFSVDENGYVGYANNIVPPAGVYPLFAQLTNNAGRRVNAIFYIRVAAE